MPQIILCIREEMQEMRKYSLASTKYKKAVNLKKYENKIVSTIHEVCPDLKVEVQKDGYLLPDNVSHGDKIKIGMALARTDLSKYCLDRPILFRGKNIDKHNNSEKNKIGSKKSKK